MTRTPERIVKDAEKLKGCHPDLIQAVMATLDTLADEGIFMMVTDGVRTSRRQQELYAQGRTTPGPIVTHADGVRKFSNHQIKADGFGHAADLCFLTETGQPSWADSNPWERFMVVAELNGLECGGRWSKFVDKPHVELPE